MIIWTKQQMWYFGGLGDIVAYFSAIYHFATNKKEDLEIIVVLNNLDTLNFCFDTWSGDAYKLNDIDDCKKSIKSNQVISIPDYIKFSKFVSVLQLFPKIKQNINFYFLNINSDNVIKVSKYCIENTKLDNLILDLKLAMIDILDYERKLFDDNNIIFESQNINININIINFYEEVASSDIRCWPLNINRQTNTKKVFIYKSKDAELNHPEDTFRLFGHFNNLDDQFWNNLENALVLNGYECIDVNNIDNVNDIKKVLEESEFGIGRPGLWTRLCEGIPISYYMIIPNSVFNFKLKGNEIDFYKSMDFYAIYFSKCKNLKYIKQQTIELNNNWINNRNFEGRQLEPITEYKFNDNRIQNIFDLMLTGNKKYEVK